MLDFLLLSEFFEKVNEWTKHLIKLLAIIDSFCWLFPVIQQKKNYFLKEILSLHPHRTGSNNTWIRSGTVNFKRRFLLLSDLHTLDIPHSKWKGDASFCFTSKGCDIRRGDARSIVLKLKFVYQIRFLLGMPDTGRDIIWTIWAIFKNIPRHKTWIPSSLLYMFLICCVPSNCYDMFVDACLCLS